MVGCRVAFDFKHNHDGNHNNQKYGYATSYGKSPKGEHWGERVGW